MLLPCRYFLHQFKELLQKFVSSLFVSLFRSSNMFTIIKDFHIVLFQVGRLKLEKAILRQAKSIATDLVELYLDLVLMCIY